MDLISKKHMIDEYFAKLSPRVDLGFAYTGSSGLIEELDIFDNVNFVVIKSIHQGHHRTEYNINKWFISQGINHELCKVTIYTYKYYNKHKKVYCNHFLCLLENDEDELLAKLKWN